jgi:glycogen debranching enzyme
VPHAAFYGTVDATPLFLTLLEAHRAAVGSLDLIRELRPAWTAALAWLVDHGDLDGDGFVEYVPAADGNAHTWKDSSDSMGHADGALAEGAIAVSEVQGYAYAAYRAAATWYAALGEPEAAAAWAARAEALRGRFHEAFWVEALGTYAMALDGTKRPLAVRNSDAGHLLWSGIVPEAVAGRVVADLLSSSLWSGWGVRTLGSDAARYNPVSYHNGSVWPHDTALCAAGFARYGFHAEARRVRDALFDLAAGEPDRRLPELVAGYARDALPPVPYPVACRPQAWDAAALVHVLAYDGSR